MSEKRRELDLSLSGSQIASARSGKSTSNRRPPTASDSRSYPSPTTPKHRNTDDTDVHRSNRKSLRAVNDEHMSNGSQSARSDRSDLKVTAPLASPITRGVSEDFLALFDSGSGARSKGKKSQTPTIKKPLAQTQPVTTPKTQSTPRFPGSARSPASTPRSTRSKKTSTNSEAHSRHSIFLPASDISENSTPQSTARSHKHLNGSMNLVQGSIDDLLTPRNPEEITPRNQEHRTPRNPNPHQDDAVNNSMEPVQSWLDSLTTNEGQYSPRLSDLDPSSARKPTNVNNNNIATSGSRKDVAANNMLPNTRSGKPPPKLELKTRMNSYQNATYNVNKTPVNEITEPIIHKPGHNNHSLSSSSNSASVSKLQAEDYIKKVNMAACKIQNAFRRYSKQKMRLRASEAAMKRMLDSKRQNFLSELQQRQTVESQKEMSTAESKRRREERAKQVRKQAVQELNRRREEEKQVSAEVAQQELDSLKRDGKIGKKKIVTKSVGERTKSLKRTGQSPRSARQDKRPSEAEFVKASLETEHITPRAEQLTSASPHEAMSTRSPRDITTSRDDTTTVSAPTTLDDLMNTLKLLEEEEKLPEYKPAKYTAWEDPADAPVPREETNPDKREDNSSDHTNTSLVQNNSKLKNILAFLDEVESSDRLQDIDDTADRAYAPETIAAMPAVPGLLVPSAQEIAEMEKASVAASEVTNTVLQQRLQLEEKNRTVQMLQKALNQQRELTIRHARETEKELTHRLDNQKTEYETAVNRHLGFIDQLIDDKTKLSEKCEQLVIEMKSLDKKMSDKIRNMQETHDRELAKLKEMLTASEKVKREKWIEEKTKQIKDLTVKGLEPEIQRLIAKHKAEIKKLKTIHEAELLQSDERAGQRYVSMTEQLRDQLAQEKEAACQREREIAEKRFEKQLLAEEEAFQQSRRRLYNEIQEEKQRLSESASRQRADMDKLQLELQDSHNKSVEVMKREFEKSRDEQDKKHRKELGELTERIEAEKEAWEQNYMKKTEAWLANKERELKEAVKRDRDREIELVITRLQEDSENSREECERTAENRIKRIRDKYESEMEELERSERQALDKHNSMKAQLLEAQAELERLKVDNKQKEREVQDVKKASEKLLNERDRVQDVVRQEFADRIVTTEDESRRVKQDMAEQKSQHKLEIERIKQEMENVNKAKQEEMDAVHARVKQAIAKKEEVVTQLRQQYQAAVKRADHLESLLEQQRKNILSAGRK